jgi:hypothetical protein
LANRETKRPSPTHSYALVEGSAISEPAEPQPSRGQWGSLVRELLAIVCPGRGFSSPAIGISGKPIAVDSLIEQPCLHGPGRHPFRDLSSSGGFASIIASWLRYFLVPSPKKRLFPFHFGLPCGSAVVPGCGLSC